MNRTDKLQGMIISALLCAIGIIIPMFCPKIAVGPMSFTLASHVPIFIAMFISPISAVIVALGTTLGFFAAGMPLVVVFRALSHVVFAFTGAMLLKKIPNMLTSASKAIIFGLLTAVIHAAGEVLVVSWFYTGKMMSKDCYASGYFITVFLLVGVGTIVHSMIDYGISLAVWDPLTHVIKIPVSAKTRRT